MNAQQQADETCWITWNRAADLTGLPLPTVEHAVRVDRIVRRPRTGTQPTLDQASVLVWAAWYRARKAEQLKRRERRQRRPHLRIFGSPELATESGPPSPVGWLTEIAAAARLDRSTATVRRLLKTGQLEGQTRRRTLWVTASSVEQVLAARQAWVSWVDAAAIIGCSRHAIPLLIEQGHLKTRANGLQASVSRASANSCVETWRRLQDEAAHAKVLRDARAQASRPPDDGQVWVSVAVAALILGVSPGRVRQRLAAGTLPGLRRGRRSWLRRCDVEQAAAAAAFLSARPTAP